GTKRLLRNPRAHAKGDAGSDGLDGMVCRYLDHNNRSGTPVQHLKQAVTSFLWTTLAWAPNLCGDISRFSKREVRSMSKGLSAAGAALTLALFVAAVAAGPNEAQQAGDAMHIAADDLGGVVSGPKGPEAGVWVIAETKDLPTKFAKI